MSRILAQFRSVATAKSISLRQNTANRHFWRNMVSDDLHPPSSVRGMTVLDRNAFRKRIDVPALKVPEAKMNKVRPFVKKLLLKMENLRPVRRLVVPRNGGDGAAADKEILLHPAAVQDWSSLPKELEQIGLSESDFYRSELNLTYENWRADEIFKFVLPDDQEGVSSFSRIGHIVHVNLRDHLEPYKQLIGEVLKDKTVGCRAVVNKTQNIDNTYRNFQLELICGDPDYKVEVKEHGVTFEFDFASVYWNPRLSTEHDRIVGMLQPSDVLYDVFAGVGPFSIPAACKRKCTVLANDLNPESFKWLNVNVRRNKCHTRIETFNKDGRDFILDEIRKDLVKRWTTTTADQNYKIHITMNLPALAVEFLDVFQGLLASDDLPEATHLSMPIVHVYTFVKSDTEKEQIAREIVEANLKSKLTENFIGVYFVRNVAPNKDMFRVAFHLTREILINSSRKRQKSPLPEIAKKICL